MPEEVKIDSNVTGLRYAEEVSPKVLPATPEWIALDPNEYPEGFGGELTLLSRRPISEDRQEKKGVTVDLDVSGGFSADLTMTNLSDLFQGFFLADFRDKDDTTVATVDGAGNDYEPASGGDSFVAGDVIFAKGFADAANNGVKLVTGTPVAASVPVTDVGLVTAATQTGIISRVGYQFGSGEVDIDDTGNFPALIRVAGTKDFTTLGLNIGEWIYIGGDLTAEKFVTTANNGFARIRVIAPTRIDFDKTDNTLVSEVGAGLTIRIYFGRVLKNEIGTLIKRRTYNLERSLGVPNTDNPNDVQGEYITGAIGSEMSINLATTDKITADMAFLGQESEQRSAATGLKGGNRPVLVDTDAINTVNDFSRLKMAVHTDANSVATPLFAFVREATVNINNNLTPNKAITVFGAFAITAGLFTVSGSLEAYFTTVDSVAAVRNNSDITLDFIVVKGNKGISVDLPLLALGDGRLNVTIDEPIIVPLTFTAATGAKIDTNLNHTMMMSFYDYLPDAADLEDQT